MKRRNEQPIIHHPSMLRGKPRLSLTVTGGSAPIPKSDSAFDTEPDRPPGIRFYRARDAFFLPYSHLHAMHWSGGKIALAFQHDDVELEGEGLHPLFVQIAEFKVTRVCEQSGDAESSDTTIHVSRITRRPRD